MSDKETSSDLPECRLEDTRAPACGTPCSAGISIASMNAWKEQRVRANANEAFAGVSNWSGCRLRSGRTPAAIHVAGYWHCIEGAGWRRTLHQAWHPILPWKPRRVYHCVRHSPCLQSSRRRQQGEATRLGNLVPGALASVSLSFWIAFWMA